MGELWRGFFYSKSIRRMSDEELMQKIAIIEGERRNQGEKTNRILLISLRRELRKRNLMIKIY